VQEVCTVYKPLIERVDNSTLVLGRHIGTVLQRPSYDWTFYEREGGGSIYLLLADVAVGSLSLLTRCRMSWRCRHFRPRSYSLRQAASLLAVLSVHTPQKSAFYSILGALGKRRNGSGLNRLI